MTAFYQVGPILSFNIHIYQSGFVLVPNEEGAEFRPTPDYPTAQIPDFVPAADTSGQNPDDGVMRPSGYRKGDDFPIGAGHSSDAANPFVIGVGTKISDAYWIEVDDPYGSFPDFEPWPENTQFFIWVVELEFTAGGGEPILVDRNVPRGVVPVKRMAATNFAQPGIIPYSKGARRLPGTTVWMLGLEAGVTDGGDPAYGNFAEAFGYPLHPGEEIYVNRLWADGKLFWTLTEGVLLEELGDALDFAFYQGTETQEPDARILADKGVLRTPGFRGLIYIRFSDLSLLPFGNRKPSIEAEFLRVDELRISVEGCFNDVGTLGRVPIECDGVDDMADGVVFETMNPRGILEEYREQYNYRIKDGSTVLLINREVEEGLTVDLALETADFLDSGAEDQVIALERQDDSALVNEYALDHEDRTQDYQRRNQQARLAKFPIPVSTTEGRTTVSTSFIITALEALELAYGMLYRKRARRMSAPFTLIPKHSIVEEGDVLEVPTAQGLYVMDVARRSVLPSQAVTISAEYMLAETGANLTAEAGDPLLDGVTESCHYPNSIFAYQSSSSFADVAKVEVRNGRIYSLIQCTGDQQLYVGAALTTVPTKISHRSMTSVSTFFNNPWSLTPDYIVSADFNIETNTLWISKTDRLTFEKESFDTELNIIALGALAADETHLFLVNQFETGVGPAFVISKLYIFDLDIFSSAGITVVVLPSPDAAKPSFPNDLLVSGDFLIINQIGYNGEGLSISSCALVTYSIVDGTIVSTASAHLLGKGTVANNGLAYILPLTGQLNAFPFGSVYDGTRTDAAIFNAVTKEISFFDVTDDPNVLVIDHNTRPWSNATHLFYLANNVELLNLDSVTYIPAFVNAPYLARRSLADINVVDGRDLTFDFDNLQYQVSAGDVDAAYHYIVGHQIAGGIKHGPGMLLKVGVDLTSSVFYPFASAAPLNDDFPGTSIGVDTPKRFYNEFATKETGEPDHAGNVGGRSVWYTFRPAVSAVYEITVTMNDVQSGPWTLGVYTGTSVDTLSEVVSLGPDVFGINTINTVQFSATLGTRYRIAFDSFTYDFDDDQFYGTSQVDATFVIALIDDMGNDNFADSDTILMGQTITGLSNRFATKEAYEPDHAGNAGGRSLWWTYEADDPDVNAAAVRTANADGPLLVAVYTGSSLNTLVEVSSESDTEGGTDDDYMGWSTPTR